MDLSRFLQAARQGCVDSFRATVYGKDSPSQPPPPDYKGAALATAQSQQASQYTPYGSMVYSPDDQSPAGVKSTISLTPDAQSTLDQQMSLSRGLASLSQNYLPYVQQAYSRPMDLSSVQGVADKAYGAMTSRLDPQWGARDQQMDQKLANQGLVAGDEAYTNAMRDYNSAKNDAYQQANLAAISTMPQTYQLASSQYNQPMNTMNALRTGAQVQNPQFQNTPGANYLGAAQAQGNYDQGIYNAQMAQQNAITSGLFGLGGAGMMAAAVSDRRLKSNIKRIGTHNLGIGIYEYDIFDRHERGVMADEVERVKPEAVVEIDGWKHVRYGLL